MTKKQLSEKVLAYLADRSIKGLKPIGANIITTKLGEMRPTVNRYLAKLVLSGDILREGNGPATTYKHPSVDKPERDEFSGPCQSSTSPIHWPMRITKNAVPSGVAESKISNWSDL